MSEAAITPKEQVMPPSTAKRWLCAAGAIVGLTIAGTSAALLPDAYQLEARLAKDCNTQFPFNHEDRSDCYLESGVNDYSGMAYGGMVGGLAAAALGISSYPRRQPS